MKRLVRRDMKGLYVSVGGDLYDVTPLSGTGGLAEGEPVNLAASGYHVFDALRAGEKVAVAFRRAS